MCVLCVQNEEPLFTAFGDVSKFKSLLDPSTALLWEPSQKFDMYDDKVLISIAGQGSRHDVYEAKLNSSPVCLKKCVMLLVPANGFVMCALLFQSV